MYLQILSYGLKAEWAVPRNSTEKEVLYPSGRQHGSPQVCWSYIQEQFCLRMRPKHVRIQWIKMIIMSRPSRVPQSSLSGNLSLCHTLKFRLRSSLENHTHLLTTDRFILKIQRIAKFAKDISQEAMQLDARTQATDRVVRTNLWLKPWKVDLCLLHIYPEKKGVKEQKDFLELLHLWL